MRRDNQLCFLHIFSPLSLCDYCFSRMILPMWQFCGQSEGVGVPLGDLSYDSFKGFNVFFSSLCKRSLVKGRVSSSGLVKPFESMTYDVGIQIYVCYTFIETHIQIYLTIIR